MRKLLIIGNGFDLAHGLPTSYNDFIFQYLKDAVLNATYDAQGSFDDDNISIIVKAQKSGLEQIDVSEFFNYINNTNYVILKYKNPLLERIIDKSVIENWVNVELEYYAYLTGLVKEITSAKSMDFKLIESLNLQFKNIQIALHNYLIKHVETKIEFSQSPFKSIFECLSTNDLILNFNYTSTIRKYSDGSNNLKVNHIHGSLKDEDNPIVFGFGDERDEYYKILENLNNNSLLKYIKSFMYFRTSNFLDLSNFVDSGSFKVEIIGHSCGLSDRTLLSYIFEHKECKKINIHYYENQENYINLTQEISRHFSNKQDMRLKIVDFQNSVRCPQYSHST